MRTIVQNTTERIYFETLDPVQSAITNIDLEVIRSDGTTEVTVPMAELGSSGIYFADINLPNLGNYILRVVSPDVLNPEAQHAVVIASTDSVIDVVKEVLTIVESIEITADNIDTCVQLMKKMCTNRMQIDETVNELIVYDDDSVTPLVRFPLRDVNGLPTSVNIFEALKGIL